MPVPEKRKRNLWPTSCSKFLQKYPDLEFETADCLADDLLAGNNVGQSFEEFRESKRRRVIKLATSYLEGRPLRIPSAICKGPFQRKDIDPEKDLVYMPELSTHPTIQLQVKRGVIPRGMPKISRPLKTSEQIHDTNRASLSCSAQGSSYQTSPIGSPHVSNARQVNEPAISIFRTDTSIFNNKIPHHGQNTRVVQASDDNIFAEATSKIIEPEITKDRSSPFIFRRGKRKAIIDETCLNNMNEVDRPRPDDNRSIEESTHDESTNLPEAMQIDVHLSPKVVEISAEIHTNTAAESMLERFDTAQEQPLSTQTALQEAHRDLLKSSPVKPKPSLEHESNKQPIDELEKTPQRIDHPRMEDNTPAVTGPPISTQNMLDAFSPFKMSPLKTASLQTKESLSTKSKSLDWSFAALQDIEGKPSNSDKMETTSIKPQRASYVSQSNINFKLAKSASQESSTNSKGKLHDDSMKEDAGMAIDKPLSRLDESLTLKKTTAEDDTKLNELSITRPRSFEESSVPSPEYVRATSPTKSFKFSGTPQKTSNLSFATTEPSPSMLLNSVIVRRTSISKSAEPQDISTLSPLKSTAEKGRPRLSLEEGSKSITKASKPLITAKPRVTLSSTNTPVIKSALRQKPRPTESQSPRTSFNTSKSISTSILNGENSQEMDLDANIEEWTNDLQNDVLGGGWNIETAMKKGLEAA